MKYIVARLSVGITLQYDWPIIFPDNLIHQEMARAVRPMLLQIATKVEWVAAGEYGPMNGSCSGESKTLGLKSRGSVDEALIIGFDYNSGII